MFILASEDRTRSNGLKLQQGRFRLDIWKKFLTVRVVKYWNKLPRKVVESPSLEILKSRMDRHLSGMVQAVLGPAMRIGDWTQWPLEVPSSPRSL